MGQAPAEATALLTRTRAGDPRAAEALTPMLYDELRRLAGSLMNEERRNHTLQPTALVHEAYVRLIDQHSVNQEDQAAFMGLAATVMRRILVDHARASRRLKRGGGVRRVVLAEDQHEDHHSGADSASADIEALDRALSKLGELDERKARLVELRFFGGLSETDAAEIAGISRATASREWRMARSWLAREIQEVIRGSGTGDKE